MTDRAFAARGSVLAASDSILSLDVHGNEDPLHAAAELTSCTVATGGTFFDVQGRRGPSATLEPLRLFVEQTVFAPLPAASTDSKPAPVLLRDATSTRAKRPIEWWQLTAADFAIEESSPARTWSPEGGPLGVDIERLPRVERRGP
jgi:hypothetical protein